MLDLWTERHGSALFLMRRSEGPMSPGEFAGRVGLTEEEGVQVFGDLVKKGKIEPCEPGSFRLVEQKGAA